MSEPLLVFLFIFSVVFKRLAVTTSSQRQHLKLKRLHVNSESGHGGLAFLHGHSRSLVSGARDPCFTIALRVVSLALFTPAPAHGPCGLRWCSHVSCPCSGPSPTQVAWSPPPCLPWLTGALPWSSNQSPETFLSQNPRGLRAPGWAPSTLTFTGTSGTHSQAQASVPGHCPHQAALTWVPRDAWSSCLYLNTSWDGVLTFLITPSVSQWL